MPAQSVPPAWKILVAFAIIYFVWGSTFLAIRVGVREVPPFLYAAMRFSIAGVVLFAWATAKRERPATSRQWVSVVLIAFLIFVLDYGLLFWAEQRVPSGVAAVMMATNICQSGFISANESWNNLMNAINAAAFTTVAIKDVKTVGAPS